MVNFTDVGFGRFGLKPYKLTHSYGNAFARTPATVSFQTLAGESKALTSVHELLRISVVGLARSEKVTVTVSMGLYQSRATFIAETQGKLDTSTSMSAVVMSNQLHIGLTDVRGMLPRFSQPFFATGNVSGIVSGLKRGTKPIV
jgi:hypothetical protein